MGFNAAVRTVGVAALGAMMMAGTMPLPAQAASTVVAVPGGCTVMTPADLGRTWSGTFTGPGQAGCFTLPAVPANTIVSVLQPVAGTPMVPLAPTVVDADGTVVCAADRLAKGSCQLTGVAPLRLVVTPQVADTVGDYRVEVLPVTTDNGCVEQLPLGTVGSDTGVDAVLSADNFAACFSIPATGHSITERFTLARTAGSGTAQIRVYTQTGVKSGCAVPTTAVAASVFWCNLLPATAYTVLVWGAAVPATFRLSQRDITSASLTCPPVPVTEIGAPAVTGTIISSSDMRCYEFTAAPSDRAAVLMRSSNPHVGFDWVNPDGGFYCTGWGGICTSDAQPTQRRYRIIVWAATTDPAAYQLDVWALAHGGVLSSRCERLPSVAYGSAPFTVALNDQQTARCLTAPVGMMDRFQIPITGADPAAAPTVFVFGPSAPNAQYYASPCPTTGCSSMVAPPPGQSTDGLFLLTPGSQFGTLTYQAQINCLTVLCGGPPYMVTGVSPATVTAGRAVAFTVSGAGFDASDTVTAVRDGSTPIPGLVRQVSADRHTLTAEFDLTSAAAGYWEVTTSSTKAGPAAPSSYDGFVVTGPVLKCTAAPAISGTVKVGATVKAVPGSWTPAATSYTYQWLANGSAISGATKSTYVPSASLRGKKLSVTITAKLDYHPDGKATSASKVIS